MQVLMFTSLRNLSPPGFTSSSLRWHRGMWINIDLESLQEKVTDRRKNLNSVRSGRKLLRKARLILSFNLVN